MLPVHALSLSDSPLNILTFPVTLLAQKISQETGKQPASKAGKHTCFDKAIGMYRRL